ncbi:uncharacterized protein [Nicotiana tomentosiformis]|uniref:uncharacterized protein n=1 Tax=Nicotiana tomentosiformis TaxID=4098 RepID=UPI00051BA1C8|nr:uncharacterized protein LOC117277959 [Nicotiana tomentosiformis]
MAVDGDTSDSTNSPNVNKDTLDSTNPLYMHPSESAGLTLVPVVFDGTGYRSWRRGVLRALSVKNKVGFITGKCKKPDSGHPTFEQWKRCDDMELEDRYDQTNGAKLYQLEREINDLSQGTLDITGYYTKMKKLWEELNTLNEFSQSYGLDYEETSNPVTKMVTIRTIFSVAASKNWKLWQLNVKNVFFAEN